ncbi:AMP-binding protein [Nocardioides ungokensis]|uniref:AMP-binding protein n=1 Tax=Nocardioides ungokensis TaxID=1643322 RepID=UPI001FE708B3|nr:AMP-binding protein [Nocardioides ungokensis]
MDFLRPVGGPTPDVVAALEAWLSAPDEPPPVVVETSGSTGRPKRVLLSRRAVLASVTATQRRLGGSGCWLLTLPASYVAGLQVACRSLVAGHSPVLFEDHTSFVAATSAMGDGDRFVSLVPTQLHRMLDLPDDVAALRTFHTVLLGGGPVGRRVAGARRRGRGQRGGDVRLLGDRGRLCLRRLRPRRGRAGDRPRRPDPDRWSDALRRLRGCPELTASVLQTAGS